MEYLPGASGLKADCSRFVIYQGSSSPFDPLQNANQKKDKLPSRKFSTFIKKLVVELDRDPTLYPDGNIVEVRYQQPQVDPLNTVAVAARNREPESCSRWFYRQANG